MNSVELKTKIETTLSELHSDIEKFARENAKFKIGDIIQIQYPGENGYFVITQVGYQKNHDIIYYGHKMIKSSGEVSFQSMFSNIGVPERNISKAILKVGKNEISRIEDYKYFTQEIKINL